MASISSVTNPSSVSIKKEELASEASIESGSGTASKTADSSGAQFLSASDEDPSDPLGYHSEKPDTPDGLIVSVSKYKASLFWNEVIDDRSREIWYEVRMDENTYSTFSNKITFKNVSVGTHTFTVRALYHDGTASDWSTLVEKTFADVTPPKTGSLQLTQVNADSVRLNWKAATDNVGIDHYIVTCGTESRIVSGSVFSSEFSGLSGKITASVTAYDAAGNYGKKVKKSFRIKDITSPSQVTGLKSEGVNNRTGGILSWNEASDDVGVTQYRITIKGGKTYKSKTNSVKIKKLPVGEYRFTVIALDKAKNQSIVSQEASFEVADETPPKIKRFSAKIYDDSASVVWKASDETGIAKLELSLDNQKPIDVTNRSTYNLTGLSTGLHTLHLTASDAAGNSAYKDIVCNVKASKSSEGMLASV